MKIKLRVKDKKKKITIATCQLVRRKRMGNKNKNCRDSRVKTRLWKTRSNDIERDVNVKTRL